MADPFEDRIDFRKLERELEAAVESDARYWRENDAKLRAVEQRVETYEQFRDMVAAAHIRPLDKEDKLGILNGRNQPWNPYSSKTKQGGQKAVDGNQQPITSTLVLPINSNDFTKQWRKLKASSLRYTFLINIGGDRMAKIFHTEISLGLLGDILSVLNESLAMSDHDSVTHILTRLSETNRFGLSLEFLSKQEKLHCSELVRKLETRIDNGAEVAMQSVKEVDDKTDSGPGVEDEQETVNKNYSNSKTQTDKSSTSCKDVPLVTKEILANIKRIYKVLPLGR